MSRIDHHTYRQIGGRHCDMWMDDEQIITRRTIGRWPIGGMQEAS
jgi:hypothetical protein